MNNYTNDQLKAALAKMLPEKVHYSIWEEDKVTLNRALIWHRPESGSYWIEPHERVQDTELLHLCWMVNAGLSDEERCSYNGQLMELDPAQRFALNRGFNATWQQRVIALCKVKGVEIV